MLKGGIGGGGVWDPQVCVPNMAQHNFPDCKCCFFPAMVTLVRGGGDPFQKKKIKHRPGGQGAAFWSPGPRSPGPVLPLVWMLVRRLRAGVCE